MKIFWSWQSDTHQPCGRYFVRNVLAELARDLNGLDGAEDAERPDADALDEEVGEQGPPLEGDRVEVDHDTQGVGGSPPIAETILRKIREAAVFVADVTPICTTPSGKRVPNPNVMVELGYAMNVLTHERIVLVMNQAEGAALKYLPFDLRHWRAPVSYKLRKDATEETIREAAAALKPQLRERIVPGLGLAKAAQRAERRSSHRQPELVVTWGDEDGKLWIISQDVQLKGVKSLEEINAETPMLPLPVAASHRSPATTRLAGERTSIFQGLRIPRPSEWSREETEGYNSSVQRYYSSYACYLDEVAEWTRLVRRSRKVELVLENTGTLPATGIDVNVTFPHGIVLYDEERKLPEKPKAPEPPPLRPVGPGASIVRAAAFPDSISLLGPFRDTHRSTSVHAAERRVHYVLDSLKHHHVSSLDPFIISFEAADEIASFDAEYVITANEPLDPIRGTIRFEVQRADD
ncbi:hypothetical protein VQH23_13805 [Pararoseomonas sp. SCSIO 73927]|uniref:hypothetical protein n=1 Tax=Pararoseomonas sp. SCSIO 73927 TaxID=3114537 RepID=UPI0030CD3FB4